MVSVVDLISIPEFPSFASASFEPTDLFRCTLVSRAWAKAFSPLLWKSFGSLFHHQKTVSLHEAGGLSTWQKFIHGFALTDHEATCIRAAFSKHGRHIRHVNIRSFLALEVISTYCSDMLTIESDAFQFGENWQTAKEEKYSWMVWSLVRASPRLVTMQIQGFTNPPRDEFRAILKERPMLSTVAVDGGIQDQEFMELNLLLPNIDYVQVSLQHRNTLSHLPTIIQNPRLGGMLIYAPFESLEPATIRLFTNAFPSLSMLTIVDRTGRGVSLTFASDLDEHELRFQGDWEDEFIAEFIPLVPKLRVLRDVEVGPVTAEAIGEHCELFEEYDCEYAREFPDLVEDDENPEPGSISVLLSRCNRLRRVKCPWATLRVQDYLNDEWACFDSLEYLHCKLVGFPLLTGEELRLLDDIENDERDPFRAISDLEMRAVRKMMLRSRLLEGILHTANSLYPFHVEVDFEPQTDTSSILIELQRKGGAVASAMEE